MKGLKILVAIAAIVVVAGAVSDAWAQCPGGGRFFVSRGAPTAGTQNVNFSTDGTDNTTNQICRIWDSDNASLANSGLTGPSFGSACPCSHWWDVQGTTSIRLINGFWGDTACNPTGCPAHSMTVVVEDYAAGAGPGLDSGSTAYYMAARVYETPAAARWWDFGLVDGVSAATTFPMVPFPSLVITGSSRTGAIVTVNYNNLDQANNVHSWDTPNTQPYPVSDVVAEWQLVKATGTTDPGRLRSNGWVTLQSTAYVPGGAPASFQVPCTNTVDDEYLAVGIGFYGGEGQIVDSALVGPAIPIECNPNLADPHQEFAPKDNQTIEKPGHVGGRR